MSTRGRIEKILRVYVRAYADGITAVTIVWRDSYGCQGTTCGEGSNLHMVELLKRAEREGVEIERC